ncbi:hypothetical protein [Delftia acidovorans]|nr:hypothetical protein [Delftia acidovorans]QPS74843.1 hypothetical protein I6G48_30285 [Delftia acidovorans]
MAGLPYTVLMTENFDADEIRAIRAKLLGFQSRCKQISNEIGERKSLTIDEKERLQELYTSLKADLKAESAALRKCWDDLSRAEECFYEPAIRKAAIALRPATNSNPITSGWFSALYDCEGEFSYVLFNLEKLDI